jgi:hypothetical protein
MGCKYGVPEKPKALWGVKEISMKKKTKLPVRTAAGTLAMIMLLCFATACQPTPEKPPVVNKGDGKLEEIIEAAPEPAPTAYDPGVSTWVETYTLPNLECEINADVVTPDTNIFPVYNMKQGTFSAEFADKVVKYFTKGATGVRKSSPTKEELTAQLVQVKRGAYMTDDNGSWWEPYEGQDEEIARLEEEIRNAGPEVFGPVPDSPATLPIDNTYSMPGDKRMYVRIRKSNIYIDDNNFGGYMPERWLMEGEAYPGEQIETLKNVKISEEEARAAANALITDLEIRPFGVATAEKAIILNTYTFETVSEGWSITLARNDGNSIPADLFSVQLGGLINFYAEDFVERWFPDRIEIFVDETGLRSFSWQYPLEVTGVMDENVAILPFEDIKGYIKNNIKFSIAQKAEANTDIKLEVSLDSVVLTNVLVPIKDDMEHQMLAPAWLVYYSIEDGLGRHMMAFAVNAVDGSSIDLSMRRHRTE